MFNDSSNKSFKSLYSFEDRFAEAQRVLEKHPYRIPVICEKATINNNLPSLDKSKYLVPIDLTVGQFIYTIRSRMKLPPEEAIFLLISQNIFSSSTLIGTLYNLYRDADGFLYVQYCKENTFG
jgi:GABA(A) receptor-associated protein